MASMTITRTAECAAQNHVTLADAAHPVDRLTQAAASGAHTGQRYGAFSGRGAAEPGEHPVGVLTHPRSASAHTGQRYGSFAGRLESEPPPQLPPSSGGGRRRRTVKIDRSAWPAEYIALRNDEDDQLLLVIAQLIASGIIH